MTTIERPFRPVDLDASPLASFDLNDLMAKLVLEPQYGEAGKGGITLARESDLTVVLEVLRKGCALKEHRAPANAMVILLSGRATFGSAKDGQQASMVPGSLVVFASGLEHSLVADEDSACLIVIGGHARRE